MLNLLLILLINTILITAVWVTSEQKRKQTKSEIDRLYDRYRRLWMKVDMFERSISNLEEQIRELEEKERACEFSFERYISKLEEMKCDCELKERVAELDKDLETITNSMSNFLEIFASSISEEVNHD